MRLVSPWQPRLSEGPAPPSERLVAALAEDILDGRLASGDRLPAHRDLADRLGIGVGTVTRAYGVLERRGLVHSVKGRGTFVALVQRRRGPQIDLARNVPPAVITERLLGQTLAAVARRVDAGLFNDYPPLGGHDEHRRLMARWFAGMGMAAEPGRLVLTSGAHHAVSLALLLTCGARGTLFTEAQTYPGVIALARHQGIRLVGVAMDEEGMVPEALERALSARAEGPAALYVTPTMQNPTTATMSRTRREEIVALCRAHDIAIIEDDVYSLSADAQLVPLAMLAPERTFYANSLSKTLNPALRMGGLVAPPDRVEAAIRALQATAIMVSPLSCALMEQWLLDGTAQDVVQAIQLESQRRTALAESILGDMMRARRYPGYHLWLPMSRQDAEQLARTAGDLGIMLTPPSATAADPGADASGIRLCLGAPALPELGEALNAIARLRRVAQATGIRPAL